MRKIFFYIFLFIFIYFGYLNIISKEIIFQVIDSSFKIRKTDLSRVYISCYDSINCIIGINKYIDINTRLSCNYIFKSIDGGLNWECKSIDCPCWYYDSSKYNYRFKNIDDGGNIFYNFPTNELIRSFDSCKIGRSNDYGKSWDIEKDSIFTKYEVETFNLFFFDVTKAIGINNNIQIGKETGYGRIFISDEDFRNWKNIPLPDSLKLFIIYSILNIEDKFFIVNDSFKNLNYFFSKSEDFGKNWTSYEFPIKVKERIGCSMFFLNDKSGWVTLSYKDSLNYKLTIFHTIDGGNNWEIISDNILLFSPTWLIFYDNQNGIMLNHRECYITKNGGYIWESVKYKNDKYFPYLIKRMALLKRNEFLCITNNGIIFKMIILDE